MENIKIEIKDTELENVTGGITIEPKDSTFWYSFNPSFAYNWGDNWGMKDTSKITEELIKPRVKAPGFINYFFKFFRIFPNYYFQF